MRYKQAVIEYSMKHGVTKAAIRYKTSRQNIYRWKKKYDGDIHSLADRPTVLTVTQISTQRLRSRW